MTISVVVCSVIAALVGAIVGWVVGSARETAEGQRLLAAREAAMQSELRMAGAQVQRAMAERDLARGEREKSEAAALSMQYRVEEAQQARAIAETRMSEAERLVAGHDQLRRQMEDTFTALAQQTLKNAGEMLVSMNRTQVEGSMSAKKVEIEKLVEPLREMLDRYQGELLRSEKLRSEAYGGLQEQIRGLLTTQESAQREAARLANALQSPTVRGSWGESTLKRCVELAGMSEFCDFDVQETFFSDEGRRIRPDLIIRLPNKRVIAVDSKAPLAEYAAASNENDETRKRELLVQHAKTIRRHIDSLSRRDYQSSVGETLDFTVMFLPGEHFLSAALVTDPSIFEFAVERKIFLASPTVLLPLLRAVEAGWKAERTEENAKKMHDAGVELFNRFVKVMELITDVGGALGKTVEKYNSVIRSIDARLWPKGEELQRMAGSGKELAALDQLEAVPLESSKLRLTMQGEEPGVVVPMK